MWSSLAKDWLVRIGALTLVVTSAPYFVPVLSADALTTYGALFAEIPLIVLSLVACRRGFEKDAPSAERGFWNLWALAFGLWLGVRILDLAPPAEIHSEFWLAFSKDMLFVGFYLAAILALRRMPHRSGSMESPAGTLRRLEEAGAFIFTFGLLVYFALIPGLADTASYQTYVPSTLLYLALDGYLVFRLAILRMMTASRRWRAIYTAFLITTFAWLCTDLLEMLMWAGRVPQVGSGTLLDLLWLLPFPPLILAARARESVFFGKGDDEPAAFSHRFERLVELAPLVAYAVVPPILHVGLHALGLLGTSVEPQRETWAFVLMCFLALIGVAHEKTLRRDHRRLMSAHARVTAEIEYQRNHDVLTGLPNRVLLLDRLAHLLPRARGEQGKVAVLYLDLDRFRVVNTSLGPLLGDALLKSLSQRLQALVSKEDTLARVAGDEFVIVVQGIRREEDAANVALEILRSLKTAFSIDGQEVFVTASIGVSLFETDGPDEAALIENAEVAAMRAKRRGGDEYQFYSAKMNPRSVERIRLETSLRAAVEANQFVLHYQPIVELSSLTVSGCEALIRWSHPTRGLLLPKDFMELAELTRVTRHLIPWILRSICAEMNTWKDHSLSELTVAVNLSLSQLLEPSLVRQIGDTLTDAGVEPSRVQLEITESLAMEDVQTTFGTLNAIREIGVRIAVDDFGTGHSSLSYLKRLPVDMLKIDRSFLESLHRDAQDRAIVSAIITLARNLGLQVTAEGVESGEQLACLRNLGCDLAQGHLLSPPLSPADFLAFVMTRGDFAGAGLKRMACRGVS